jgi:site-specific DNA-methyltransferase (adenine-specific)
MGLPAPYFSRDNITIYHGDCREILPLIESVDLVLTDPPYGDAYSSIPTTSVDGTAPTTNDGTRLSLRLYRRVVPLTARRAFHDGPRAVGSMAVARYWNRQIIFGRRNRFSDRLPTGLVDKFGHKRHGRPEALGLLMSDAEVAWFSHGRGVYLFNHTWDGFNRASERNDVFHPTQKPVALMRWILTKWSKPNDLIFDPYMGSWFYAGSGCVPTTRPPRHRHRDRGALLRDRRRRDSQTVMALDIPAKHQALALVSRITSTSPSR